VYVTPEKNERIPSIWMPFIRGIEFTFLVILCCILYDIYQCYFNNKTTDKQIELCIIIFGICITAFLCFEFFSEKYKRNYLVEISPNGLYVWYSASFLITKEYFIPKTAISHIELLIRKFKHKQDTTMVLYLKNGRKIKNVCFLESQYNGVRLHRLIKKLEKTLTQSGISFTVTKIPERGGRPQEVSLRMNGTRKCFGDNFYTKENSTPQPIKPLLRFPQYRGHRRQWVVATQVVLFVKRVYEIFAILIIIHCAYTLFILDWKPDMIFIYGFVVTLIGLPVGWCMLKTFVWNKNYIEEINTQGINIWHVSFFMKKIFIKKELIALFEVRTGMFYRNPYPKIVIYFKSGGKMKSISFCDTNPILCREDEAFWARRVKELQDVFAKIGVPFKLQVISQKRWWKAIGNKNRPKEI